MPVKGSGRNHPSAWPGEGGLAVFRHVTSTDNPHPQYELLSSEIADLGFGMATVAVDLGKQPCRSGKFTISTPSGWRPLVSPRPVLVQQAYGPYHGKGSLPDEAEMDQINVVARVRDSRTIECIWQSPTWVRGSFRFDYIVSSTYLVTTT